jgi:hypothetical protein
MEAKLSPQIIGQPQVSAQDFFHSGIVNSEVGCDRFQSINASPIGGVDSLVNHENGVRSGLTRMRSEIGENGGRGNLASIVENNLYGKLL